jgi:hypothetical protein
VKIKALVETIGAISRILLAVIGVAVGGFLYYAAYTSQLGDPSINGIVIIIGLLLLVGCGSYLLIKVIKLFGK